MRLKEVFVEISFFSFPAELSLLLCPVSQLLSDRQTHTRTRAQAETCANCKSEKSQISTTESKLYFFFFLVSTDTHNKRLFVLYLTFVLLFLNRNRLSAVGFCCSFFLFVCFLEAKHSQSQVSTSFFSHTVSPGAAADSRPLWKSAAGLEVHSL